MRAARWTARERGFGRRKVDEDAGTTEHREVHGTRAGIRARQRERRSERGPGTAK